MLGIFRAVPFTCALLSQCDLDLEPHTVITNCQHNRALRQGLRNTDQNKNCTNRVLCQNSDTSLPPRSESLDPGAWNHSIFLETDTVKLASRIQSAERLKRALLSTFRCGKTPFG